MKRKLSTILFTLVLMFSFVLNVNAEVKIKENADMYTGEVYIIGSSKFDSGIIINGTMATIAGARETKIQYQIYENWDFDPEDIRIYHYSEAAEAWSILPVTSKDEKKYLTEEEVEELTENLNIYYVNEEEKMLEIPYDIELEKGYELKFLSNDEDQDKKINYEGGKIKIPATVKWVEIVATKPAETEEEIPVEKPLGNVSKDENNSFVQDYSVVRNYKELVYAIDNNIPNIHIVESIELLSAIEITNDVTMTIDGDVEISVKNDIVGNGVFRILEDGHLFLSGYGTINGAGNNNYNRVIYIDGGKLTLNDDIYFTNTEATLPEGEITKGQFSVIDAKGNAEIEINGGRFESKIPAALMNYEDTVKITIAGGSYYGYNPEEFVIDAYKITVNESVYTVSMGDGFNDKVSVGKVVYNNLGVAMSLAPAKSTVKLLQNIELTEGFVIDKEITLDLDGHYIVASTHQPDISLMYVKAGGKLTITGNGTINAASQGNDYSMAIWAYNGGEVIIENGTITNLGGKSTEDDGDPNNNELLYVTAGGKITINGGRFIGNSNNETHGTKFTLNQKDNSDSEIIVKGGTFVNYNPADAYSEPTQPLSFLAEGYKVVENGDEYTVMPYDAENVTDELELITLLKNGESVKIGNLIQLTKGFAIDKEVTLDLNGNVLYASEDQADISLIYVKAGGKLTVTGEGTINAASQGNDYSMAIWAYNGGEVIIENGTITNLGGKSTEDDGDPNNNELLYVTAGGKITINGGRFIGNSNNETHGTKFTLNQKDNSESEIIVKGGTFVAYNPADAYSEPTQPLSFLAEGYKVILDEVNNEYTVVPYDAENVTDENELRALVVQDGTIKLGANIDLKDAISIRNEVTVDLNGHNLTVREDVKGNGVFLVWAEGKLTINGEGIVDGLSNSNYSKAIWAYGGEVIINGGTYTNVGAGEDDHYDLIYANNGGKITVNGGTFIGHTPKWTLNLGDNSGSVIEVKGGTFVGFNPANADTEPAPAKPKNFVAEGYKVVEGDGEFTVVAE